MSKKCPSSEKFFGSVAWLAEKLTKAAKDKTLPSSKVGTKAKRKRQDGAILSSKTLSLNNQNTVAMATCSAEIR